MKWYIGSPNVPSKQQLLAKIEHFDCRGQTQCDKTSTSLLFSIGGIEERNLKEKNVMKSTEFKQKNSINVIKQLRENYDQFVTQTNRTASLSVRLFRNI